MGLVKISDFGGPGGKDELLFWREDRQFSQEQMAKQYELDIEAYRHLESVDEGALKALAKIEHSLDQNIFVL